MLRTIIDRKSNLKPGWLLVIAIIFFVLLFSAEIGLSIFAELYKNRIYPNVFIGGLNLGGKSGAEAKRLINQATDKINRDGIIFSYKNFKTQITPVIASTDGGLAYEIINFDADQAAARAFSFGREANFFVNLKNKLLALTAKKSLTLTVAINREEIIKILKDNFTRTYKPAQDASLIITKLPAADDYEFSVAKEKLGKTIDYEEAIDLLTANLANLDSSEIKLSTVTEYPKILIKDALNIESQAKKFLTLVPLVLKYEANEWLINRARLIQFLTLKLDDSSTIKKDPKNERSSRIKVGLDENEFITYLAEQIGPKINKKPLEAKLEINNGRVTEFQNSQDGLALNLKSSFIKIENLMTATNSIELVVDTEPALTKTADINSLGIKEIIGVGTSNFAGSPANRRHNIRVGANSVNGTLIKPGEEFSLLKVLGEVDGSTGYLPELVIKEGKTLPEFGGGLCQVGTTVFRTVIASGLPVTMRRNHSYRVQYYEPAGTDATIYNPWPDFRFINDSANYILIQTKIASNTLSFEFWGAKDGRQTEVTKPTIYNIVKPESTKIIETLSLKPGEKKCTEHAHNGADAYFDYKVTYPTGEIKTKRFSSHYVPWREVCLLGVEKLSAPPEIAPSASLPSTNLGTSTFTPPISTNKIAPTP